MPIVITCILHGKRHKRNGDILPFYNGMVTLPYARIHSGNSAENLTAKLSGGSIVITCKKLVSFKPFMTDIIIKASKSLI